VNTGMTFLAKPVEGLADSSRFSGTC